MSAKKKSGGRKGGATHKRRSNPAANKPRRASRHRRNPAGFNVRSIVPFAVRAGIGAVEVMAGKIVVRKVRGLVLKQKPGSIFAVLAEAGMGLVGGMLLSSVNRELGERFAIGGVLAPMETLVQNLALPFVSDALGDDGFMLGDGVTVESVSGFDDVAGYVGNGGGLAGYVPGRFGAVAVA